MAATTLTPLLCYAFGSLAFVRPSSALPHARHATDKNTIDLLAYFGGIIIYA